MNNDTVLLSDRDAAKLLGLKVSTLQKWRWLKTGPAYIKLGKGTVRYRHSDLQDFISSGLTKPGEQQE